MIIQAMADHAALLAQRFGDLVDEWGTVNEPINYLLAAYGVGYFPPGTATRSPISSRSSCRGCATTSPRTPRCTRRSRQNDTDRRRRRRRRGVGRVLDVGRRLGAGAQQPAVDEPGRPRRARPPGLRVPLPVRRRVVNGTFDSDLDGMPDEPHPEWAGTLDWLGLQYYFRAGVSADRADPRPAADAVHCTRLRHRRVPAGARSDVLRAAHGLRGLGRRHRTAILTAFSAALPDPAARRHRGRHRDRRRRAPRREHRARARGDRARARRGRRRARLLPLEPDRQLRVGRGLRAALRAVLGRLRELRAHADRGRDGARRRSRSARDAHDRRSARSTAAPAR